MDHSEKTDCERIQKAVLEKRNIVLTLQEAHQIWEEHSDKYAAGWLILPDDDGAIISVYDSNHWTEVDNEFERWWGNKDYDCGDAAATARIMAKEAFIHGIACGRQGLVT